MPLLTLALLATQTAMTMDGVAASAAETKPLTVGAAVPSATLRTIDGKPVALKDALGGKKTVLVFYRGGWCPFCNLQMQDLQARAEELKGMGYQVVAVSPDRPEELKKSLAKNKIEYTLLSDSKAEAIRKFGLAFRVEDALVAKYKNDYKIDLEASSGEAHHILPVPAVFLVRPEGTIAYAFSNPDYKVRLNGDDLVAAAKAN